MMTVHKLTAGDGYTYLTRQVASHDEHRDRGQDLVDYYTATGNPPGRWMGRGTQVLGVSGSVSEAQMKSLFGHGLHPDADRIATDRLAAGESREQAMRATRLGRAFPQYTQLPNVDERVAQRVEEFGLQHGRLPTTAEHRQIQAQEATRQRHAVAGYDLVFTPVKSVSLLWALGGEDVRRAVERAHHAAVADTLDWLEQHAAFTRTGDHGEAQIETHGLIATAFDHRDSRIGDPNLHTHLAVSNKVLGVDGQWRSLDARALFHAGVAASERYNTRIEDHLSHTLGVRFAARPDTDGRDKREVREIVGVPGDLIRHFSRRRQAIEEHYADLLAAYRRDHGKEPPRAAQVALAQQATLDTREAKQPGQPFGQQLAMWRAQAEHILRHGGVQRMLDTALGARPDVDTPLDPDAFARAALDGVQAERATWTRWNVLAEVERGLRPLRFPSPLARERAVEQVLARATSADLSIRIAARDDAEPWVLRRLDGTPAEIPHASERYTTTTIVDAEQRLLSAAFTTQFSGVRAGLRAADRALASFELSSAQRLDDGQRRLAHTFATDPHQLVVGIGPAGSGKTTAMRALHQILQAQGRRLIPLAASAKAARVLGDELGTRAENLHKYVHELDRIDHCQSPRDVADDEFFRLRPGDVVLVDEAGMAGTLRAARLVDHATKAGAVVRALGDPQQFCAIEGGGWLRLVAHDAGAIQLTALHRFTDLAKAGASLRIRAGDTRGLDYFEQRHAVHGGSQHAMPDAAYEGWQADMLAGKTSLMAADSNAAVCALNRRARLDRVAAGQVEADGVELHDDNRAGIGDWIVTRQNNRRALVNGGRDFVKNGDLWVVRARHTSGALTVQHLAHGGQVHLPPSYIARHAELAYATTGHRAQGSTVDTEHTIVTPETTREALYVMTTRARDRSILYVITDATVDLDQERPPAPPTTAREVLEQVLARSGAERSATDHLRQVLRHEKRRELSHARPPLPTTTDRQPPRRTHSYDDQRFGWSVAGPV